MTALEPATAPTLYFFGVTTTKSSIMKVFPAWAKRLGLDGAMIKGVDFPLHAPPESYRAAVAFLKSDPKSLGALVTTHKIDLYHACRDQFDVVDRHALVMGETSCLSKQKENSSATPRTRFPPASRSTASCRSAISSARAPRCLRSAPAARPSP